MPYLCIINNAKIKVMQEFNLKVGDIITFTNKTGYKVKIEVTRVEAKSWYSNGHRSSYGTLRDYKKSFADFKITQPAQ